MASNTYLVVSGFVQKFPDKDAVVTKDANGQKVREFTVKAVGSQKLVRISVWPEFAAQEIKDGDFVNAEGKFSQSEGSGGTMFFNLSASKLTVTPGAVRADREVVNQKPSETSTATQSDDIPF